MAILGDTREPACKAHRNLRVLTESISRYQRNVISGGSFEKSSVRPEVELGVQESVGDCEGLHGESGSLGFIGMHIGPLSVPQYCTKDNLSEKACFGHSAPILTGIRRAAN